MLDSEGGVVRQDAVLANATWTPAEAQSAKAYLARNNASDLFEMLGLVEEEAEAA